MFYRKVEYLTLIFIRKVEYLNRIFNRKVERAPKGNNAA